MLKKVDWDPANYIKHCIIKSKMFFFAISLEFYSHQQVRFLFIRREISVILNVQCQGIDIFSISCKTHVQWMTHNSISMIRYFFFI